MNAFLVCDDLSSRDECDRAVQMMAKLIIGSFFGVSERKANGNQLLCRDPTSFEEGNQAKLQPCPQFTWGRKAADPKMWPHTFDPVQCNR